MGKTKGPNFSTLLKEAKTPLAPVFTTIQAWVHQITRFVTQKDFEQNLKSREKVTW